MSAALTPANKRTLKRLLGTGRWGNESEIVRYGLHLVELEVEARQKGLLPKPVSYEEMDRIYRRQTPEEKAIEKKLGKISSRIKPEPEP